MRLTPARSAMLKRLAKERVDAAYLNKRVLNSLRRELLVTMGGTIGQSWMCLTSRGRIVLEKLLAEEDA